MASARGRGCASRRPTALDRPGLCARPGGSPRRRRVAVRDAEGRTRRRRTSWPARRAHLRAACAGRREGPEDLERYVSLAPLRQPNNPAPISTLLALRPGLPQVAEIVEPATRGDPTQLLLWTSRSLRN